MRFSNLLFFCVNYSSLKCIFRGLVFFCVSDSDLVINSSNEELSLLYSVIIRFSDSNIYSVDNFDRISEWRHGRGGHLTLRDEDVTSKTLCGWRKLNTLAHYGIRESAVMSLIPRTPENYAPSCKQPCQNCKCLYSRKYDFLVSTCVVRIFWRFRGLHFDHYIF